MAREPVPGQMYYQGAPVWNADGSPVMAPGGGGGGGSSRGGEGGSRDPAEMERRRKALEAMRAGHFANVGEADFSRMTEESQAVRDYLRQVASGEHSVSGEQLRQGLQQNQAQQQSMAAGASSSNAPMMARNAAMNMGRASSGMAGQAAIAGLQERQNAQQALSQMLLGQRGQDVQVGLGARGLTLDAYGKPVEKEKSFGEKYGPAAAAVVAALSDERLKHDIKDGDDEARRVLDQLRAKTFHYNDEKHGKGKQLGIIAQDLERGGLRQAVIDKGGKKMVDGAKLATALAAMMPGINARISKLEGKPNREKRNTDMLRDHMERTQAR